MELWRIMSDLKYRVDLVGSKGTHPFPTHTQGSGLGQTLDIVDVTQFFVDKGTTAVSEGAFVIVGTYILSLGSHHNTDLEAHTDFHLVFDAETQFQRHINVCRIHFIALEVLHIAIVGINQRVGVWVHDAAVGKIVVRGHAHANAHCVFRAFAQREIISKGETYALVETTWIPVVARLELEITEKVETKSDSFVCFVRDELGKGSRRNDQCNEGEKDFLHVDAVFLRLKRQK